MKMYISVDSDGRVNALGSTPFNEESIEIDVPEDHEILTNPFIFVYQDGLLIKNTEYQLELIKKQKIKELQNKCRETILSKFMVTINGVDYYFSNDEEAQRNFAIAARAFDNNIITEQNWTAHDSEGNTVRITLNADTFQTVYEAHLRHIFDNISRFRDTLFLQVKQAQSAEEVFQIVW